MPTSNTWTADNMTVTVETDDGMTMDDQLLYDANSAILTLHQVLPLTSLDFTRLSAVPAYQEYRYRFTTFDGRLWRQRIRIGIGQPVMNFNVDDFFSLADFANHRDVRDLMIELASKRQLSKYEVTWI